MNDEFLRGFNEERQKIALDLGALGSQLGSRVATGAKRVGIGAGAGALGGGAVGALGGAALGGGLGYLSGGTPEEKRRRALMGAVGGGALGGLAGGAAGAGLGAVGGAGYGAGKGLPGIGKAMAEGARVRPPWTQMAGIA